MVLCIPVIQLAGNKDLAFVYITDEELPSLELYNNLWQKMQWATIPRYVFLDRDGNEVDSDFSAYKLEYELTQLVGTDAL